MDESAMSKRSNPRILGLDLLRGYFMFVIIVNHIGRFPSFYDIFTGRGLFWVSAAEGFFLISGLLIGYVYGPKFLRDMKSTTRKLWLRAGKIYLWSISFTLLFTLWGLAMGLPPGTKAGLLQTNFLDLLYQTLTLKYVYGWADFLVHFVVFILFAPLALYLISKKKWWLVIIASLAVWFFRGNSFNLAWQVLFNVGIVFGFYLPIIEKKFKELRKPLQSKIAYSIVGMGVAIFSINGILIWLSKNISGFTSSLPNFLIYPVTALNNTYNSATFFFNKDTLGPGRLILDIICFAAIYFVFRKFENLINKRTFGFFEVLGTRPLFVYGLSATILFPLQIMIVPIPTSFLNNFLIDTVVLATIYLAARYRKDATHKIKQMVSNLKENNFSLKRKELGADND